MGSVCTVSEVSQQHEKEQTLSVDSVHSPERCFPDVTCVVLFGACIEGVLLRDK